MTGQQLKNSILQLAIEGRLVAQCPTDEPASALLQRIRQEKQALVKAGTLKKKDLTSTPITDDEKPFDIPESWEWCRLGEIAFVTKLAGFEYTAYIANNLCGNEGIPLFKGKNVQDGKIVYEFEGYIPETISDDLSRSQITRPCLLTPYVGTIGNIGLHNKTGKYHLGSNVGKIDILCPDEVLALINTYVLYYLRSTAGLKQLSKFKKSTAQESISIQAIREVFLPLPPLAEQRRIVARIEELMPLVEQYGKAQGELEALNAGLPEALKKSILQEAIQGRLVPQCATDEPASALLQRIRREKEQLVKAGTLKKKDLTTTPITDDEKPFDIPEGWEWCRLGEVINLLSGQDLTPDRYNAEKRGIPYMTGASNFIEGNLLVNRWSDSPTSVSHQGDLLVTCKGTVGEMAFNNVGDVHIARQIMAISSLWIHLPFVLHFIEANLQELKHQANSMIPGISRSVLLEKPIPLPPLAEQRRIVAKIEELFALL